MYSLSKRKFHFVKNFKLFKCCAPIPSKMWKWWYGCRVQLTTCLRNLGYLAYTVTHRIFSHREAWWKYQQDCLRSWHDWWQYPLEQHDHEWNDVWWQCAWCENAALDYVRFWWHSHCHNIKGSSWPWCHNPSESASSTITECNKRHQQYIRP